MIFLCPAFGPVTRGLSRARSSSSVAKISRRSLSVIFLWPAFGPVTSLRVEQSTVELIRSRDQHTLVIFESSASEEEPSERERARMTMWCTIVKHLGASSSEVVDVADAKLIDHKMIVLEARVRGLDAMLHIIHHRLAQKATWRVWRGSPLVVGSFVNSLQLAETVGSLPATSIASEVGASNAAGRASARTVMKCKQRDGSGIREHKPPKMPLSFCCCRRRCCSRRLSVPPHSCCFHGCCIAADSQRPSPCAGDGGRFPLTCCRSR